MIIGQHEVQSFLEQEAPGDQTLNFPELQITSQEEQNEWGQFGILRLVLLKGHSRKVWRKGWPNREVIKIEYQAPTKIVLLCEGNTAMS